jgi:hypothetical protein
MQKYMASARAPRPLPKVDWFGVAPAVVVFPDYGSWGIGGAGGGYDQGYNSGQCQKFPDGFIIVSPRLVIVSVYGH